MSTINVAVDESGQIEGVQRSVGSVIEPHEVLTAKLVKLGKLRDEVLI
jgi:hypothetical protein